MVEAELCAAVSDVLTTLGFQRLHDPAEPSRPAGGDAARRRASPNRSTRSALVALDKLDKIGATGPAGPRGGAPRVGGPSDQIMALFCAWRHCRRMCHATTGCSRDCGRSGARPASVPVNDLAALVQLTAPRRAGPRASRSQPRARAVILHGRHHGDRGAGSGRQPRRRRPLRQPGRACSSGRDVPACGFSLGLERIIVVMDERGMFPDTVAGRGADVMVTLWNEGPQGDALALAAELRQPACGWTSIRKPTSSASSSSTLGRAGSRW